MASTAAPASCSASRDVTVVLFRIGNSTFSGLHVLAEASNERCTIFRHPHWAQWKFPDWNLCNFESRPNICLVLLFFVCRQNFVVFFFIESENDIMLNGASNRLKGLARHGTCLPAPARRLWQHWVVVASMLALMSMLVAAVAHEHTSSAIDDDSCLVCNLAFDTLDEIPVEPVVTETPAAAHYYTLLVPASPSLVQVATPAAPAGCGPPPLPASRLSA
jgi:hypothetical protein